MPSTDNLGPQSGTSTNSTGGAASATVSEPVVTANQGGTATVVRPAVAQLTDGNFVTVWQTNAAGADTRIYAQLHDETGALVEEQILVTPGNDGLSRMSPAVTALDNGAYAVAYYIPTETGLGIALRVVAPDGGVGTEQIVATGVNGEPSRPSIATLDSGEFVVAWDHESATPRYQLFSATGALKGEQQSVPVPEGVPVLGTSIAGLSEGGYAIAWLDLTTNTVSAAVYASADLTGGAVEPVEVPGISPAMSSADASEVQVAALDNGDFVVTWVDHAAGVLSYQVLQANGDFVGNPGIANDSIGPGVAAPTVTALGDGGFVIGWVTAVS